MTCRENGAIELDGMVVVVAVIGGGWYACRLVDPDNYGCFMV